MSSRTMQEKIESEYLIRRKNLRNLECTMYMRRSRQYACICISVYYVPSAIVIISFSCNGQIRKNWTAPPTLIIPAPPSLTAKG